MHLNTCRYEFSAELLLNYVFCIVPFCEFFQLISAYLFPINSTYLWFQACFSSNSLSLFPSSVLLRYAVSIECSLHVTLIVCFCCMLTRGGPFYRARGARLHQHSVLWCIKSRLMHFWFIWEVENIKWFYQNLWRSCLCFKKFSSWRALHTGPSSSAVFHQSYFHWLMALSTCHAFWSQVTSVLTWAGNQGAMKRCIHYCPLELSCHFILSITPSGNKWFGFCLHDECTC